MRGGPVEPACGQRGLGSMRIAMIGAGYVGLVSGACFADFGHDVVCVDKDEARSRRSAPARSPIYEPGLSELVAANQRAGRLSFTGDIAKACAARRRSSSPSARRRCRATAAPTCATSIRRRARSAKRSTAIVVVVNKSTSPIGACDEIERDRRRMRGPEVRFAVASQPGIPARGRGDRRFQAARPGGDRRRGRAARPVMREIYRPLEAATAARSSTRRGAPPS